MLTGKHEMARRVGARGLSPLWAMVVALAMLVPLLPSTTVAQDVAEQFKGKRVTIIVGTSPGGGYDVFARLVARFGGKYLPGAPTFVVQNIPGGGQLRGLRSTMKAKPDGLTVGLLNPRFVQRTLIGMDVPDFDLDTVRVLGSPSGGARRERMVCARRDIATSWAEVVKLGRPLKSGGVERAGSSSLGPEFVELIGGPIKMVFGYAGGSEVMAAFDRGELEITERCTEEYVPRLFPEWIRKKILAPLFWWEASPSEDWLRRIGASAPPHLFDVVKVTEHQKKAFELGMAFGTIMGRVFVMPPSVPDAIYQAWKQAFEATVRDPGFLQGAKVAGVEVGLATAEDFAQVIRTYRELSPAGRDVFKRLVGES
jgi:hypothetical protein